MAVAIDQTNIGFYIADVSASTMAFNTSNAVASNGFIVLTSAWVDTTGNTNTMTGVSGGGLTWTIDKQALGGTNNNVRLAIISAQAPSGLASGTTITASLTSAALGGLWLAGMSFTGVATSSPVDGTPPAMVHNTSGTAWVGPSQAVTAGSVMVNIAYQIITGLTSTTTSPALEAHDQQVTGNYSATDGYLIQATGATVSIAGAWSSAAESDALEVSYLQGAAAPTFTGGGQGIVRPGRHRGRFPGRQSGWF